MSAPQAAPPPRFDLATFGEGGLRLGVPTGRRIQTATQFDVHVAGAEANVACTLARLGRATTWVSSVADTPMGERVLHTMHAARVDTSGVRRVPGGRTGVYFIEHAHPPRPTRMWYDRAGTALATTREDEVDWETLLAGRYLHASGVTAGLSEACLGILERALREARARGATTSFDVNWRRQLWSEARAREAIEPLLALADLVFCSRRDAAGVLGIAGEVAEVARALAARTGAGRVVVSDGTNAVTGFDAASGACFSAPSRATVVLDRAGAGDALVSGVLHGLMGGGAEDGLGRADGAGGFRRGLALGQTLAAMTVSQFGDRVVTTAAELETLALGDGLDIER